MALGKAQVSIRSLSCQLVKERRTSRQLVHSDPWVNGE